MNKLIFGLLLISSVSCKSKPGSTSATTITDSSMYKITGSIERYDEALDAIVSKDAKAEIISEGFTWSEGPLWLDKQNKLIFSDVPKNTIFEWSEAGGTKIYLQPSGYTDSMPSKSKEPGSNGLALDTNGNLVLCQHGNRQVAQMIASLDNPKPIFNALAGNYNGKKLSSPNDCVFNSAGDLFFTDPPYGLPSQGDEDVLKEIPFNGIYKVKKDGKVILLSDSITRPNGIAFFPGDKSLLVASSDPAAPNWYQWDIAGDKLENGRVFYSAKGHDSTWKGLPDGLKIDSKGNVYASGPGGIYFFNSEGKILGILRLDYPASNCALSADERILYVTNNMYILRIKLH